ncbi:XRE family transcriptional regulator [Actinokineospora globicatena]|uniref:XRE family transcriptional regulator n=1 Tax=Actinokineospora globicatena TaxID=103729 RepID=A0A9W6QK24_9PSEU|nr:XRE family transcriptional regulator [Actinokineospora globicatena]GLW90022.1 hypothetical protein Aglo03_08380 [Actinokineospora globicatena]
MKQPPTGWVAVARALDDRLRELGWRQWELAQRSQVSQAVIRELQYHTVERSRGTRTLEALSTALGWHQDHLHAVLHGIEPRLPDAPADGGDPVAIRLDVIERRMAAMSATLNELRVDLTTLLQRTRER